MSLPRIWRGALPDGQCFVVVNAHAVDRSRTGRYTEFVMSVLDLDACHDLVCDWRFHSTVSIEELLTQLDSSLRDWPSVCMYRLYAGTHLHAIGLGSNKERQKRAGRLALALAALLQEGRESMKHAWFTRPGCELNAEFELAKGAPVLQLRQSEAALSRSFPPGPQDEQRLGPSLPASSRWSNDVPAADRRHDRGELWMPASGSWIWWLNDCVVVLCENMSSSIFAGAKNHFLEVTGEPSGAALTEEHFALPSGTPDIFCAGFYNWRGFKVVGVGRRLEARFRAACVGLAGQIGHYDKQPCSQQWRRVRQEIFQTSPRLPDHFLPWYHDLKGELFWQNIEEWRKDDSLRCSLPVEEIDLVRSKPIGAAVLQDIMMNCQPALLAELQRRGGACGGYAEVDLTESHWPWPRIVAGHSQISQIVGPGILQFALAVDRNKICPYQQCPLVHFVVTWVDGSIVTFSSLSRTDDDRQNNITRNDRLLAFRLAAGWAVKGRWQAFQRCVFVNIVQDFEKTFRAEGWLRDDFQFFPQQLNRTLFAWTLSVEMRNRFQSWLENDRRPCPEIDRLRISTPTIRSCCTHLVMQFQPSSKNLPRAACRSEARTVLWSLML